MIENLNFIQIIFILSIFISIIIFGRIFIFYNLQIKKWNKTTGKIIQASKEYFRSNFDLDTEGWKDKIVFEYIIDGKKYLSNKVSKNLSILLPFENQTSPMSLDNFNLNEEIDVYYNPRSPKETVLDSKFNYFSLSIVLIFYIIIYFFIF